jgi:hypothetical protein
MAHVYVDVDIDDTLGGAVSGNGSGASAISPSYTASRAASLAVFITSELSTTVTAINNGYAFSSEVLNSGGFYMRSAQKITNASLTETVTATISTSTNSSIAVVPLLAQKAANIPTGITAGTEYCVLSTGLASNSFRIATAAEGTAINTTGTQNGPINLFVSAPLIAGKAYAKQRVSSNINLGGTGVINIPMQEMVYDKLDTSGNVLETIDTRTDSSSATASFSATTYAVSQKIVPKRGGILAGVTIRFQIASAVSTVFALELRDASDNILATTPTTSSSATTATVATLTFTTPQMLVGGTEYRLVIRRNSGDWLYLHYWNTDPYDGGSLYDCNTTTGAIGAIRGGQDLAMKLNIDKRGVFEVKYAGLYNVKANLASNTNATRTISIYKNTTVETLIKGTATAELPLVVDTLIECSAGDILWAGATFSSNSATDILANSTLEIIRVG